MDVVERKKKARGLFTDYLRAKKGRCTAERMAILDVIVERRTKITIDELVQALQTRQFRVALGTLYNTLRELQDARMVRKSQIGRLGYFQYRDNSPQKFHQVCTRCGKVTEFQNAELEKYLKAYKPKRFVVEDFSVTLQGLCSVCIACQRKEEKKQHKKNTEQ